MAHSKTCSLLMRRFLSQPSKRHITCRRPTARCSAVAAPSNDDETSTKLAGRWSTLAETRQARARCAPSKAGIRRNFATIQSGTDVVGSSSGDTSNAASDEQTLSASSSCSTSNSDNSIGEADSISFRNMTLRDIDVLVEEFESCSTSEGLANYLGGSSSNLQDFSSELYDLIDVCAKRRNRNAARIAERVLGHWIYLSSVADEISGHSQEEAQLPPPAADAFNSAMLAWADAGTRSGYGAKRAEEIMKLMQSMPSEDTTPNIGTYTTLLKAWSKSGERRAPYKVLNILEELEIKSGIAPLLPQLGDNGTTLTTEKKEGGQLLAANDLSKLNVTLIPDRVCYNLACSAWSKSTNPRAPNEIRRIMSRMESMAKALEVDEYRPNTKTWNMLIHSYARLGQEPKVGRDKRRKRHLSSRQSDTTLGAEDYARAAEAALREMHALHLEQVQSGKVALHPEDDDYDVRNMDADNNIRPSITSYNGILNAWSNMRGNDRAAKRAEAILNLLLESAGNRGESSTIPTTGSDLPIAPGVEPNIITYNTLIKCWARSVSPEAGERAESILSFMNGKLGRNYLFNPISREARWNSDIVRPNVVTWNATMDCWSKSGAPDGAARAEKLLMMMLDNPPGADGPIHPNAISFATAIYAWSKSLDEDRAEKAAALLDKMKEMYQFAGDDSLKPTSACYAGVIFAHVGVGNVVTADNIVREMREEEGILPPTSYSNAILEGYSRAHPIIHVNQEDGTSTTVLPIRRVREIFDDVVSMGRDNKISAPDAASFHYLLATCASCTIVPTMRKEALHVALSMFDEVRETRCIPIKSSTYVEMFELLSKLMPKRSEERTDIYRGLFEKCCEDGLLNKHLLHLLTHAVTGKNLRKMLSSGGGSSLHNNNDLMSISLTDLPAEWSNGMRRRIQQKSRQDKGLAGSKPLDLAAGGKNHQNHEAKSKEGRTDSKRAAIPRAPGELFQDRK